MWLHNSLFRCSISSSYRQFAWFLDILLLPARLPYLPCMSFRINHCNIQLSFRMELIEIQSDGWILQINLNIQIIWRYESIALGKFSRVRSIRKVGTRFFANDWFMGEILCLWSESAWKIRYLWIGFCDTQLFGYGLDLLKIEINDSKLMFVKLGSFNVNLNTKPWLPVNMLV